MPEQPPKTAKSSDETDFKRDAAELKTELDWLREVFGSLPPMELALLLLALHVRSAK